MSNLGKLNYYIVVITIIFGCLLYDFINTTFNFSFIDEILALILFTYWLIKGNKKATEFYVLILVFLFYLLVSLNFPHNKEAAIWMDFLIEIKPYIAFYTMYNLNFFMPRKYRRRICKLCIISALLLLPIGLINPGGGVYMNAIGTHARFATMAIILGTIYLFYSHRTKRDLHIASLIYAVGLLSLRSKMFGFYALFVCIMFLWNNINKKKLFSSRTLLIGSITVAAITFVAWEKISFYFLVGTNAEDMFARPFLYLKAFEILQDYPLFGTGFGSYATYASAAYYSPLYITYKMYLNNEIGNGLFICDTFFPAFAQFGYAGILLFIYFWKRRINKAQENLQITGDIFLFKMILIIIGFFFIESIVDSTFTHNRGMIMMMFLALFLKKRRTTKLVTPKRNAAK